MLARRGDVHTIGECLDDLDVRRKTRTRVRAFKEIVTQQGVVGHAAGEGGFKRVDVVNALAGVAAFRAQVLIQVRHGKDVGIDAA